MIFAKMTSVSLINHRVTEESLTPPLTSEIPGTCWLALGKGLWQDTLGRGNAVFQLKQSLGGCQGKQVGSSQAGFKPQGLQLVWNMESWTFPFLLQIPPLQCWSIATLPFHLK